MLNSLARDLRFAIRMLAARPGFALVAVLTLAIGIGANAAIFSVVNAVLIRPLHYEAPERLVRIWSTNGGVGDRHFTSPLEFVEMRARSRALSGMAAVFRNEVTVHLDQGPVRVASAVISWDLFDLLGLEPTLGRSYTAADGSPDTATPQTIISHGMWQREFGGDPDVLERSIDFGPNGGGLIPITGVMPPEADIPADAELWFVTSTLGTSPSRADHWLDVYGRLAPGVTVEAARTELGGIMAQLGREDPATYAGWSMTLAPLHEVVVGDTRPALLLLLAAAGTILLIACANVANLVLSRSEDRQREIALRAALGAGRSRIGRQLLTESLLLAFLGAAVGMALAAAGVRLLVALGPERLPRLASVTIDGTVLGFALTATLLTGVVFGLAPLLRLRALDLSGSLKDGGKTSTASASRERLRSAFVVVQVALSVILVVGAGLLIQSLARLSRSDPGFDPAALVTAELTLPQRKYGDSAAVAELYRGLLAQIRATPGVESAGAGSALPLREAWDYPAPIFAADQARPESSEALRPYWRMVTPGFFEAMGVRLLRGRDFASYDDAAAHGVAILNRAAAQRFWPGQNPIGRKLDGARYVFGNLGETLFDELEVIGVVEDMKYADLRAPTQPSVYFPHRQAPFRRMTVVARTRADPEAAVAAVREAVGKADPDLAISRIWTMRELMSRSMARDRFSTLLLGTFGAVALLLAAVGIYGVISFAVACRIGELGVRVALGASSTRVIWLVLRRVALLLAAGLALGTAGAVWLGRLMTSQLFGVSAADPATFAGVAVLLSLVALAASVVPTMRALRVDPVEALRGG